MEAIYEKRDSSFTFRDDGGGKSGLTYRHHLHYHVEIVYMIEGAMQAFIDSESYIVNSGDMLVVFPNQVHRFVDLQKGIRYNLFIISPSIVPELEEKINTTVPVVPVIKNAAEHFRIASTVKLLSGYKEYPDENRDLLLRGYVLSLFSDIMEMMELNKIKPEESHSMRLILDFCNKNFIKEISLAELEKNLHLSRYYISHVFGDKLGTGFNDYINSLRVGYACKLLQLSNKSITEISSASGFGTLRTFNRAFIKHIGKTPSEYKKYVEKQSKNCEKSTHDKNVYSPYFDEIYIDGLESVEY